MDPFGEDFDPICPVDSAITPCSSFDGFERQLARDEPELAESLLRYDEELVTKRKEELAQLPSKRERRRQLELMTSKGAAQPDVKKRDKSAGIKVAKLADGGVYGCMERWLNERSRVCVKLRADRQEPNRLLQGVVVAFDKHWNLVLRDVDEVYTPPLRLGKVQTSANAIPSSIVYASSDGRILYRYLPCSLVTGSSIVCVYKQNDI